MVPRPRARDPAAHGFDLCGNQISTARSCWIVAPQALTEEEKRHVSWSATEFLQQREAGAVTCEAYARTLVKRATHYASMNQFMYWGNDPGWTERVVAKAIELDRKAAAEGTQAIAPLFCLPIAMKGTVATVAFKSSAGVGILHGFNAVKNATIVDLIESKHGIVFGKTNVPEFAASLVTCST